MVETETLTIFLETRPRRDVGTSRDRLETETSRPRPQPCYLVSYQANHVTDLRQHHQFTRTRSTAEPDAYVIGDLGQRTMFILRSLESQRRRQ